MKEIKTIWGRELHYLKNGDEVIKLIEARDNLSVQVHTNKIETFIATTASRVCTLPIDTCVNMVSVLSLKKFTEILESGEIFNMMKLIHLPKWSELTITPGTVHCILEGSSIFEVSKGDQVTLRLYDFDRGRQLDSKEIYNYYRSLI